MIAVSYLDIEWMVFSIPKYGNFNYENEDAVWPSSDYKRRKNRRCFRCAVSDGATQSSFSNYWANLLVQRAQQSSQRRLKTEICKAQKSWKEYIALRDLPWHAEIKVRKGAHATLLWLQIDKFKKKTGGKWKALAIGDTCLFQISDNNLICSFPITDSNDFDNTPKLINSITSNYKNIWDEYVVKEKGAWENNDQFFLLTDALAYWFLNEYRIGNNPSEEIHTRVIQFNNSEEMYSAWINDLRNEGRLRNDDTSLVWLKLIGDAIG